MRDPYTHKKLDMLQLSKIRQAMTPIPDKTAEMIWDDLLEFCCDISESGTDLNLEAYDQSEYYADVSRYTYSYTLWSSGIGRKLFRLHLSDKGFPLTAVRILKNSGIPEEANITNRKQLRDYMLRWTEDPFVRDMVARANPRELTEEETNKCIEILRGFTESPDRKALCKYRRKGLAVSTTFTGSTAVNEMKHDLAKVVNFEKNTVLRGILASMKYSKLDRDIQHDDLLATGADAIRCFAKDILQTWKDGEREAIHRRNCTK